MFVSECGSESNYREAELLKNTRLSLINHCNQYACYMQNIHKIDDQPIRILRKSF